MTEQYLSTVSKQCTVLSIAAGAACAALLNAAATLWQFPYPREALIDASAYTLLASILAALARMTSDVFRSLDVPLLLREIILTLGVLAALFNGGLALNRAFELQACRSGSSICDKAILPSSEPSITDRN